MVSAQHLWLTSPLLPLCAGTPPPSARSAGGEMTPPPAPASGWLPAAQRACDGADGSQQSAMGEGGSCHLYPYLPPRAVLFPAQSWPCPWQQPPLWSLLCSWGQLQHQAPRWLLTGLMRRCRRQPGTSRASAAAPCWSQARPRGTCTCSKHTMLTNVLVIPAVLGRQVTQQNSPSPAQDTSPSTWSWHRERPSLSQKPSRPSC